ncbi:MAG: hypothetical protein AAF485_32475 [Chloroflexota bacterium]
MATQTITQSHNAGFLNRVLQANAIFSATSGLLFMAASGWVDNFLGLGAPLALVIIGAMLFAYSISLFQSARQTPVNRQFTWTAIVMDAGWVVGSIIILVTGVFSLTVAGNWAVAIVADIVAMFAILQYYGLKRQK